MLLTAPCHFSNRFKFFSRQIQHRCGDAVLLWLLQNILPRFLLPTEPTNRPFRITFARYPNTRGAVIAISLFLSLFISFFFFATKEPVHLSPLFEYDEWLINFISYLSLFSTRSFPSSCCNCCCLLCLEFFLSISKLFAAAG